MQRAPRNESDPDAAPTAYRAIQNLNLPGSSSTMTIPTPPTSGDLVRYTVRRHQPDGQIITTEEIGRIAGVKPPLAWIGEDSDVEWLRVALADIGEVIDPSARCTTCDHVAALHRALNVDHQFTAVPERRELRCSSCRAVVATITATLPISNVQCQQCSLDPECASWCPTGDGHPGALFDTDKVCWSADASLALTLERPTHANQMPTVDVCARRQHGGPDSVYLSGGDGDFDMTVAEARQLAATLLQIADQVEAG